MCEEYNDDEECTFWKSVRASRNDCTAHETYMLGVGVRDSSQCVNL